jgi:hypothetical protein
MFVVSLSNLIPQPGNGNSRVQDALSAYNSATSAVNPTGNAGIRAVNPYAENQTNGYQQANQSNTYAQENNYAPQSTTDYSQSNANYSQPNANYSPSQQPIMDYSQSNSFQTGPDASSPYTPSDHIPLAMRKSQLQQQGYCSVINR